MAGAKATPRTMVFPRYGRAASSRVKPKAPGVRIKPRAATNPSPRAPFRTPRTNKLLFIKRSGSKDGLQETALSSSPPTESPQATD